jgi:molecular chaperone GrpE (heat shock protein)
MKTWQRIKHAWTSLTTPAASGEPPHPTNHQRAATEQSSALARLRLDVQAREAEIARLRDEFVRQEQQAAAATATAGGEAVAALLRALAPTLSQLTTLRYMADAGREVRATDALKLCAKLEGVLADQGLERIGEVGAESAFDPALHQRMSGGDVQDGDRVRVRFVGYRFRGETPVKALVSRVGQEDSEGKE